MDDDMKLVRAWCAYWVASVTEMERHADLVTLLGIERYERLVAAGLL